MNESTTFNLILALFWFPPAPCGYLVNSSPKNENPFIFPPSCQRTPSDGVVGEVAESPQFLELPTKISLCMVKHQDPRFI